MSHMTDMLMKAWHFRHACKEFDPKKKISDADFHTILEGGRCRPALSVLSPGSFWWSRITACARKSAP